MSSTTHVTTALRPTAARISTRSLDEVSEAIIAERCERARDAGREEALEELGGGLGRALAEAAARLDAAREEAEEQVASYAIDLSIQIASMLLRRELDAGNIDLDRIVRESLQASGVGRAPCVVHLAPSDIERVDSSTFRTGTRFESDPHLAPGDVHITTPQGLLVRELDACLGSIRDALFGVDD